MEKNSTNILGLQQQNISNRCANYSQVNFSSTKR